MSVLNNEANEPVTAAASDDVHVDRSGVRRRRILVNSLRVLFLVVIIGGWELAARVGIIDSFYWGRPSGIFAQIMTWITQGTAQGP